MILLHRDLHKDSRTIGFANLRISTEFQSLQLEITKESLKHYSYESLSIQITPWTFLNFNPRSLAGVWNRGGAGGRIPAPRVDGGEGKQGE